MKRKNGTISFLLLLMGIALITLGIGILMLTGGDYNLAARYRDGVTSQCLAESGLAVAVKILESPAGAVLPARYEYQSSLYNTNGTTGYFILRIVSSRNNETLNGAIYSMGITGNGVIKRSVAASYSRPTIFSERPVVCNVVNIKSL